ncbi:MAG: hypothetical protein KDK48_05365, partial [Chlamydiia bacterium]|nr:hypothetical protein [Chlamydiia bacterium]
MKLIRLMRLKKERQKELKKLARIRSDLKNQVSAKEAQIIEIKKDIKLIELEVQEIKEKIEKLEAQQNQIKKVDEFNALTHEVSTLEKQRHAKELAASDLIDKQNVEEDLLKELQSSLAETDSNSRQLEEEIY